MGKTDLNTKAGNVRGVRIHVKENGGDWKKYRAQGWVISQGGELKFSLNSWIHDDLDIDISLTADALFNMVYAIDDHPVKEVRPKDYAPVERALDTFSDEEYRRYGPPEDRYNDWWDPWEF